ncbi:MAG TPA: alcohol dehydrogenase catalytic domain-containing protein [Candidatus Elarobacter sp.]|jgi:threonine dehydrogenase-like Zn-dependent dehydrogenase|nr:alcohol dehydrogenase catalytic domain-containing protein [Candidatus Elarobacter sp.]
MAIAAAVAAAPGITEVREFAEPEVPRDGGLLRIEAAGVCGSDVPAYRRIREPTILGHENVGRIEALGEGARERWGVEAGDRVLIEEYLPCGHCAWCRGEEFRLCDATDIWMGGIRYGSTPVSVAPALWGGFSRFQYLHPRSVLHRVADGIPAELAALAIPLSNGFEWVMREARAAYGATVVIQGPGQQGLACVVAAKLAGAARIVISGLASDARRLEVARLLGADDTIVADGDALQSHVRAVTEGRMADVVIEASSGGPETVSGAIRLARKRGTVVLCGEKHAPIADFDADAVVSRVLRVIGVRGHGYASVERALALIASRTLPLEAMCTDSFGLGEVDRAIRRLAGEAGSDAIHVTVLPWA